MIGDESFVSSAQRTSILCCRLTDFSLLSLLLARSSYNLDLDEMGLERMAKKCLGFSLDRTINFQLQCLSFCVKKPRHYLTENR